jgi:aryl-alcohol dehydrogenase-like predicted oxidoreductase
MGFKLISNQPQYSMLWRVIEAEVIPTSVELGLGQIVWSPMAQGILTGKYLPGQPAPAGSRGADPATASIVERFMNDETLTAVQNLRPLADGLGISMAQFALAWVLQNSAVSAAIVGASNAEQISSNIAASGVEIPAEVMKQVDEVLAGVYQTDPALTKSPDARPC